MNKQSLIDEIIRKLTQDVEALKASAKAAHEAATHEESKAEDQHDTRGLEASYLAGAQQSRIADLEANMGYFRFLSPKAFTSSESVDVGALVQLTDEDGKKVTAFIVAQSGGFIVSVGGVSVQIVTTISPLGEAILGRKVGDAVEVEGPKGTREFEILSVT